MDERRDGQKGLRNTARYSTYIPVHTKTTQLVSFYH